MSVYTLAHVKALSTLQELLHVKREYASDAEGTDAGGEAEAGANQPATEQNQSPPRLVSDNDCKKYSIALNNALLDGCQGRSDVVYKNTRDVDEQCPDYQPGLSNMLVCRASPQWNEDVKNGGTISIKAASASGKGYARTLLANQRITRTRTHTHTNVMFS